MISGTIYGIALNDRYQRDALGGDFTVAPYNAPPEAPVVYVKTANTVRPCPATVTVPADLAEVEVGATVALLFGDAPGVAVAACLSIDLFEPHDSFYRPAIRQHCRDGFLPVGGFAPFDASALGAAEIVTRIDGAPVHRWSLERLFRPIGTLIRDLSAFMTLADGDMLLVGLPGDAPRARAGARLRVEHGHLPSLDVLLAGETA